MTAHTETAAFSPTAQEVDSGPVGNTTEQPPKLPDYGPLTRHFEAKYALLKPGEELDLDSEAVLALRWDYETFLERAQIGQKKGPLYNRFREEKVNAPLALFEKDNPNASEADIAAEMLRLEGKVQKRINDEALVAEESRKRADEELEKIRKKDPVFADLLKEQFEGVTVQEAEVELEQRITEPVEIINFEVIERQPLAA